VETVVLDLSTSSDLSATCMPALVPCMADGLQTCYRNPIMQHFFREIGHSPSAIVETKSFYNHSFTGKTPTS
jgi:hypothetical protein